METNTVVISIERYEKLRKLELLGEQIPEGFVRIRTTPSQFNGWGELKVVDVRKSDYDRQQAKDHEKLQLENSKLSNELNSAKSKLQGLNACFDIIEAKIQEVISIVNNETFFLGSTLSRRIKQALKYTHVITNPAK